MYTRHDLVEMYVTGTKAVKASARNPVLYGTHKSLRRRINDVVNLFPTLEDFILNAYDWALKAHQIGYMPHLVGAFEGKGKVRSLTGGVFEVDVPEPKKKGVVRGRPAKPLPVSPEDAKRWFRQGSVLQEARGYRTFTDFEKVVPGCAARAYNLGCLDKVKQFFERELSLEEVLEEAATFRNWKSFSMNRPRYADAADRLRVGMELRRCPHHLSTAVLKIRERAE